MSAAGSLFLAPYLGWRFEHWSEQRLAEHQAARLRAIVAHAATRSGWYRERIEPDTPLERIPPMDKPTMMRHFNEINTAGLDRDRLVEYRIHQEHHREDGYFDGRYSIGLSSGTSGNKVLTVLSPRERDRYAALLWARSGIPRGTRPKRVLFALRASNKAFTTVSRFGVVLVYVDYLQSTDRLISLVNEHRLNVLAGPPSILTALADRRTELRTHIDAVISYAEELDGPTRARLESAFDVRVAEIYQGAEGMLGVTCRAGTRHLNEDVVHVELGAIGDTLGAARSVMVTDLYRTTQPFIRYRLDDVIEVGGRDCPCGSSFRTIEQIHGRADNVLTLRDARGHEVRLMPDYVRRSINRASPDIEEYQAIQTSTGDIEIRLQLAPGTDRRSVERTISANLGMWSRRAGAVPPDVSYPSELPERNPRSGKLVRVVKAG